MCVDCMGGIQFFPFSLSTDFCLKPLLKSSLFFRISPKLYPNHSHNNKAPQPKQRQYCWMRKNRFNKYTYHLIQEHEEKVESEIHTLMESMKIKAINNNLTPRRTGGIPLTENTLASYDKHYDSLYFFFAHIQNYESLLMLRREPLEYSPSMNPSSIILHHKWKIDKKGTPLTYDSGTPVNDLDGKPILCVGTWVSPENLEQCRSAISTLHKARNMIGTYDNPCLECIELDKKKEYQGAVFIAARQSYGAQGTLTTLSRFTTSLFCILSQ
jgi:hypothetical protein